MSHRVRLTITLPPELLRRVDRMVDGRILGDRSQAIESMLRGSMGAEVSTAVILAGAPAPGGEVPALIPIQGRPVLEHTSDDIEALLGVRDTQRVK